jgi:hypothetical protein
MTGPTRDDTAIWVVSDVAADGTYAVTIHLSDDVAFTLDRDQALGYAAMVAAAGARAAYDAAVFRQLRATGMPPELAASVVRDLRADRPPLPGSWPLGLDPFVGAASFDPGVYVLVNGERVGQWTVEDASGHAADVLTVLAGADLDAAYRRHLFGAVGLDDDQARARVAELREYLGEGTSP